MTFAVFFQGSLAFMLMIASGHLRCHADETGVIRGDGSDGKKGRFRVPGGILSWLNVWSTEAASC